MAKVIYQGPDDVRELGPSDLKGVEVDDYLVFPKDQPIDVTMTVALTLVTESGRYGNFIMDEADSLEDKKTTEPKSKQSSKKSKG